MPWKNSWFQLAALVAVMSGGLLIYDFGPGAYSFLMAVKFRPTPPPASPSAPQIGPVAGQPWTNSLGVKFVPAGTDEVLFSIWDVRVKDYKAFINETAHEWREGLYWSKQQTENDPATYMNWADAHDFCDWLTKKERLEGILRPDQCYRLPTDAEWSRAVGLNETSEGTPKEKSKNAIPGIYPWGTQWPPPAGSGDFCNLYGYQNSYKFTSPVGSFPPNQYGLYDMSGNVAQWCEDKYDDEDMYRVLRGGAWDMADKVYLLSAVRDAYPALFSSNYDLGFRVVVTAPSVASVAKQKAAQALLEGKWPKAGQEWTNSLGLKFVPAGTEGVLFCTWDVRVQDWQVFIQVNGNMMWNGAGNFIKVKQNDKGGYSYSWEKDENASWQNPGFAQGSTHPVVGIGWNNAWLFCQWLTYKERSLGMLGPNQSYRLPKDEEWSTAAGTGKYPWGDAWPPPDGAGNYGDQAFASGLPGTGWPSLPINDGYARTSPVGSFRANAYGLFDMGGNVYQWCQDQYIASGSNGTIAAGSPVLEKAGTDGAYKILRGGAWMTTNPSDLFSAHRSYSGSGDAYDFTGFRLVVVTSP